MAARAGGGLSPLHLYPLPTPRPDGPLLRLARSASSRWQAAWPRRRAGKLRAEGAKVAQRAAAVGGLDDTERRELLCEVRGRLRQDFDCAGAQQEVLALVGAAWAEVFVDAGGALEAQAVPTGVEYAAALGLMRGRLVEVGGAPDPERVAMLAVMALAPWGGGVHLVLPDAEQVAGMAERLERLCARLGLSVGCVEAGQGPEARRAAWAADIACVGVGELVGDTLRDARRLADHPGDLRLRVERLHGVNPRAQELVQRGLRCAVVLEADRLLLDEALRTVVLSADAAASAELQSLALAWDVSALFEPGGGLATTASGEAPRLTDAGRARLADMLAQRGGPWSSPQWRGRRIELALLARHALEPGLHYEPADARIEPVQPAFGALVPDPYERRLVLDLLAIRHERDIQRSGTPVATMSVMECLIRYPRLGGTLGSAGRLARRELRELYGLAVLPLAERPAPPPEADTPPLSAGDRKILARARAEHRQVAGRLQKLLAFSGS